MSNYRGKSVLVDIEMDDSGNKPYTGIHVPIPEVEASEKDGLVLYGTGRLWVSNEAVRKNKSQPDDGRTLGVAFLHSNKDYKVLAQDDEGNKMYVNHTGRELREFNEEHGAPAVRRMERDKALAEARMAPGAQMSLFDDWAVPGTSDLRSVDANDADFEF